jgi:hypothetical protein
LKKNIRKKEEKCKKIKKTHKSSFFAWKKINLFEKNEKSAKKHINFRFSTLKNKLIY